MARYESFKREMLNLPNAITIGRVLMIPPVLVLVDANDPWRNFLAMLLFGAASLLDALDGWLARHQGIVTVFGKFMDPLADKIMVMALLVYLVHTDAVPPWVVVVLLGRDFYINGLRTLAGTEGVVIAAGRGGKVKTAFQMVGICAVIVRYRYRLPGTDIELDFHDVGMACIYASVLLSIVSAIEYTMLFARALRGRRED